MRARRLFYRQSWDQRLESFIERRPLLSALIAAPFLFGLIFLAMGV